MMTPTPGGERNPLVLAAAAMCGVDRVFAIGGAQAIGALAYGTADGAAGGQDRGPRQCLCGGRQAPRVRGSGHRHGRRAVRDPGACAMARPTPTGWRWTCSLRPSTTSWRRRSCCARTGSSCKRSPTASQRQLPDMPRREVIAASLRGRGALITVRDLDEACELANRIAPEHLELSVQDPQRWLPQDPPCRRDLPRPLHLGGAGRLLRRAEPRPAHCRHRALLLAARGVRLPEAHQPDRGFAGRGAQARCDRRRAGHRARVCRPTRGRRNTACMASRASDHAFVVGQRVRPVSCELPILDPSAALSACAVTPDQIIRDEIRALSRLPRPGQPRLGQARRDGEPVRLARANLREEVGRLAAEAALNRYPDPVCRRR